jgi:protein TonB
LRASSAGILPIAAAIVPMIEAPPIQQRLTTGVVVAILHVVVIYGLIAAFASGGLLPDPSNLALLATFTAKPKPPPVSQPARHHPGGAPMPAAKRAKAAPVVAAAIIPVAEPRPPAKVAAAGVDPTNGSAQSGQGSGGGGAGEGAGNGTGNGDGDGTDLRQIAGAINENDYPREAIRAHQSGKVQMRFTVGTNGRVSDCTITKSSGSPSLDATTCRLILQRFRYEPSRDAQGRPYADTVDGEHEWHVGGRTADDPEGGD